MYLIICFLFLGANEEREIGGGVAEEDFDILGEPVVALELASFGVVLHDHLGDEGWSAVLLSSEERISLDEFSDFYLLAEVFVKELLVEVLLLYLVGDFEIDLLFIVLIEVIAYDPLREDSLKGESTGSI